MTSPKLRIGDIGFAMDTDSWLSKAIAWFMQSKWSHCFMVLDVTPNHVYLLETSNYNVWISRLYRYDSDMTKEYVVFRPDIPLADAKRFTYATYEENIGKTYGYLQLISLGVRCLFKRFGIKISNFIRAGLVCCHVPLYGYRHSNIDGLAGIDPESIDTEDLYQLISGSNRFRVVREKRL